MTRKKPFPLRAVPPCRHVVTKPFVVGAVLLATCLISVRSLAQAPLTYLGEYAEPYYPGTNFPKLITPQWIGEDSVDAVVTLGIDDMRDTAKYETYLRPILERLKRIDGRAPVSIMTCRVDPQDPQLQTWLREGLSIEVHTVDHPCPCLQGSDFEKAKSTYDRCVDMMASIPNNTPVAFRTPCCDSRNTPSPRLWKEIFNGRTPLGNFLQADSSVFNVFTTDDPELPRELVNDADGTPRFKKYIPFPSFVNTVSNYPYPYVIGKLCWQFPCMVPSDWEAQNLQQPNNPATVEDMKAALDATVIKKGMFNLVFHPHGWIRNDQVIQLIDYAQSKYGKRVRFLTFKECVDRINKHLLLENSIRVPGDGADNGVRIVDLNSDGYLDVMIGNDQQQVARIWKAAEGKWHDFDTEIQVTSQAESGRIDLGVQFGRLGSATSLLVSNEREQSLYTFEGNRFLRTNLPDSLRAVRTSVGGVDQGVRLRDLDGDGEFEVLLGGPSDKRVLRKDAQGHWRDVTTLPAAIVDEQGRDNGVRFVDFDGDGHDDLIVSNGKQSGVFLYDTQTSGFTRVVEDGSDIPLIVRDGTNNGVWFARDHLWVQNEDTHRLADGVDRRSFAQLLGGTEPGPRSPELSLKSIKPRPGFAVELMAAEPLVMDPIALDWGADGKLWVVEMADYPLGLDDKGKPGGRVRYLEDTDGDGRYDKSTLFLDEIAYPTGVIAWRHGVIVSAAPTVFFAADRDGDGKADVREDLYRGFGEGNQQHRVNGFERGLDNWLYLANGDSGGNIESVKTGAVLELGGQDLRVRPDDGSIDLQSGRTQFGRHRDDVGNWFGCSNPLPLRHFVLADHYLRRNPHVKQRPARNDIARIDNTQLFPISRVLSHWSGYKPPPPGSGHKFTSACSTMVYRDRLFGDEFRGSTFTCAPVHNAVHRRRLVPDGVTFKSVRPEDERGFEFLASTDSWFRPTTVTTGPDGALWVVDMYRLVIEHPEWIDDQREKEMFLRAGHDRGRIYRVYPAGDSPRAIAKLGGLESARLVERLASPNGRVRDLAQELLVQRDDSSVVPQLTKMVGSSPSPLGRLHALCTLDAMRQISADTLKLALRDSHPGVLRHAVRISESFIHRSDQVASEILTAISDCNASDPHVRLQVAYSMGQSNLAEATELLSIVASSSDDPYLQAAVISSLGQQNMNEFYRLISEDNATVKRYQRAITEMAVRLKDDKLIDTLLTDLIISCEDEPATVEEMNSLAAVLRLLRDRGVRLKSHQITMLSCLGADVVSLIDSSNEPLERRVATISLLPLLYEDFRADVLALLTPQQPVEIQIAAAEALIAGETEMVLQRLSVVSPSVRAAILRSVLARESSALKLAELLRENTIALSAIGTQDRRKMLAHPSKKVAAAARGLFGEVTTSADKSAVLKQYQGVSPSAGDATAGKQVFTKHCAACHRVKKIGHVVGPDLAALKNRSPMAMLTAVLDPNAAVEDKYRSYSVLTFDGVADAGIIAEESSTAIRFLLQDGKSKTILRDDIELLQSTGKSLMPEEMEKVISPADMNNLLAFLGDIGPSPKQFAGNTPTLVTAAEGGVVHLTAATSAIFGDQIRFEPKHQNIGYWGHADDYVQWTLQTTQPGSYEVWLEYACPDGLAGNRFQFRCGDQSLTGKIEGTGTWDDYRQVKLGTVNLGKARTVATFQSAGSLRKWLLDLKSISLKPVQ